MSKKSSVSIDQVLEIASRDTEELEELLSNPAVSKAIAASDRPLFNTLVYMNSASSIRLLIEEGVTGTLNSQDGESGWSALHR